jgi:hypothetical protein
MTTKSTPSQPEAQELLVCGLCGRVNHIPAASPTRGHAVRCTGCGTQLRGDRTRKVSVACPSCERRLEVAEDWLGRVVRCGACGADFEAHRPGGPRLPGEGRPPGRPAGDPAGARVAAPEPEDVEEETDSDGNRKVKVRRRRRKKRKIDKSSVPWGLVFGALLTFSLIGAIIGVVGKREGWWHRPPLVEGPAEGTFLDNPAAPVMRSDEWAILRRVTASFLAAEDFAAQQPYARSRGGFLERAAAYQGNFKHQPFAATNVDVVAEEVRGGRLFLRLAARDAAGLSTEVTVERLAEGVFLVDWDSYVRYSSADWLSFTSRRPAEPQEFQVYFKRHFEGHPAYPVEEFNSYFVFWKSEDDGYSLFVRRGSPEEEILAAATAPGTKPSLVEPVMPPQGVATATLRLFFRPESNADGRPPAMELGEISYLGWVDPGRAAPTGGGARQ